jgi:hypothetical protein
MSNIKWPKTDAEKARKRWRWRLALWLIRQDVKIHGGEIEVNVKDRHDDFVREHWKYPEAEHMRNQ